MNQIGGIPVDELKRLGLSNEDLDFIRDKGAEYDDKITRPGMVTVAHGPNSVVAIASTAFQQGIALGIAKSRGLTEVQKRIGF